VPLPHFADDSEGQTIWIADAHRGDGKAFRCACWWNADCVFGTRINDPPLAQIVPLGSAKCHARARAWCESRWNTFSLCADASWLPFWNSVADSYFATSFF